MDNHLQSTGTTIKRDATSRGISNKQDGDYDISRMKRRPFHGMMLFLCSFSPWIGCKAWTPSYLQSINLKSFSFRNPVIRRQGRAIVHAYSDRNDLSTHDEEDGDDESENSILASASFSSDWVQSEFTLRTIPSEPSPALTAETVAVACCRSLQWVDYPTESAGLKRCFDFFTFECRKAVTARQGGGTPERFCQYGLQSPALQPFYGATRIEIGNATYTPAQPPL